MKNEKKKILISEVTSIDNYFDYRGLFEKMSDLYGSLHKLLFDSVSSQEAITNLQDVFRDIKNVECLKNEFFE